MFREEDGGIGRKAIVGDVVLCCKRVGAVGENLILGRDVELLTDLPVDVSYLCEIVPIDCDGAPYTFH